MIKIMDNKGFHLTVGKYTLSVQTGPYNYCGDYYDFNKERPDIGLPKTKSVWESENAEVAVWTEENWCTEKFFKDADQVKGYVKAPEIARAIKMMYDLLEEE